MDEIRCAFCGTASNELPKGSLLKGQGSAHICAPCVVKGQAAFDQAKVKPQTGTPALPKPVEIKALLDEHVISQDRAKKDLAVAVYNHYKRRDAAKAAKAGDVELSKSNILLLGPSGTGKTLCLQTLARTLNVPFYCQDSSALTMSGYVGADTEDILRGLVEASNGDPKRAEWGIVLLDEFDKLARKSGRSASGYRDVSGEGVQQGLLKIIEGDRVAVTRGRGKNAAISMVGADGSIKSNVDIIDTTNILFVAAGSFAGIEEIVDRRVNKKARVGFGGSENRRQEVDSNRAYELVTQDDILDFGIIPEILGRLPILTSTYELTEGEMLRILTEPKNSLIKQFRALFAMDDIELTFDQEALSEIAKAAKLSPTGARSLRTIVEKILGPHAYSAPSDPSVKSIRVTAEMVRCQ
jgi:ATP-dependent Clp protease ATP-binding subunit ClpX